MERKSSVKEIINMFENTPKNYESKVGITEINNNCSIDSESTKSTSSKKYTTYEGMTDVVQDFTEDTNVSSVATSVLALVPKMEKLELSQKAQSRNSKRLAGHVKAVVPPTGIVVVQPAAGSRIFLDIGTALFIRNDNNELGGSCVEYDEIGFISDIFGSVFEPMYSLQLKQRDNSLPLRINAQVFYLHEHSSTRYISVRCDNDNRYTVMHE